MTGRGQKKASDCELVAAYAELCSLRATADRFGMCAQSVHERLLKLGACRPLRAFTEDEADRLRKEYTSAADAGKLADLAESMGRTKAFICRKARDLGMTNSRRSKPYMVGKAGQRMRDWHASNEHPRGALGIRHSDEAKAKIGAGAASMWSSMTEEERGDHTLKMMKGRVAKRGSLAVDRPNATWKAGWREIGGIRKYYRSRWEANYARYLEWLKSRGEISSWAHEPETFWFEAIRRGVRSYLPDFRVWENDGSSKLHEVKGWMDDRSKTTLRRMAKYHPQETIILIDAKQYGLISAKVSRLVEGWE